METQPTDEELDALVRVEAAALGLAVVDKTTAPARYDSVNGRWPDNLPTLTPEEAIRAAKRLYRFAVKRPWRGPWKATSGRRYTWPRFDVPTRTLVYFVNYTGHGRSAWRDLVHDMSHYIHRQRHPKARPHDIRHEILEREMVAHVVASGWLDGRLKPNTKPAPSKDERDAKKLAHARAMLQRAATREKRATTIKKGWLRTVRRLERKAGDK